jgi:hypothetical protein
MNRSKLVLNTPIFLLLFLFGASLCFAQAVPVAVEPSHDVTLQVIIGTNDGAGQPLPADLSTISRHLKSNFPFTNYRVAETFLGRVGNRGDLEYKSVFNLMDQKTDADLQTFLEWTVRGLKTVKDVNDKTVMQADTLRFGGRVPLKLSDVKGNEAAVTHYESIGLKLDRLTVPVGAPTLIGSVAMTKALGTMFIVVTVKPAL